MVYGVLELGFHKKRLVSTVPVHAGSSPFPGQDALASRISRIRSFGRLYDPNLLRDFLPDYLRFVSVLGYCGPKPTDLGPNELSNFSGRAQLFSRFFSPLKLSPSHAVIVIEGAVAKLYSLSDQNVLVVTPRDSKKYVCAFDSTFLDPTDRIRFGPDIFDFSVSVLSPKPPNCALLIGNRSDLRGVDRDVSSLSEALKLRGMRIFSAFPTPTKFDLCCAMYKLAEAATFQSTTLISFSGHGTSQGLTLSGNSSRACTIEASEFYALLDLIPGKKIVILDACETVLAGFLSNVPRNCFVISASDSQFLTVEEKRPHIPPFSSDPWDAPLFPRNLEFGGVLTSALLENLALLQNSGEIAAGALAANMARNPTLASLCIDVLCAGDPSISIPPKISLI